MESLIERIERQNYIIIAEIGVNYYDIARQRGISNMEAAKLMCHEAFMAGADAVKFQTYKAGKIASKYSPSYWDTKEETTTSQYELFKKYDAFGEQEYRELSEYCNSIGVCFLSTPFDFESADYLNDMMEAYKISSSDITNIPFIEYIAKKNKPILLSTGAANRAEIQRAYEVIRKNGNWLALLHCVLEYPTPYEDANLGRIVALKNEFPDAVVGYSDHTKPSDSQIVITSAYGLGAQVIEKHFTLDKKLSGNDHYHAMDVDDLKKIKRELEVYKVIIGTSELEYLDTESAARKNARRSIVANRDIKEGQVILEEDICFKRPGVGIEPSEYKKVIGMKAKRDIIEDTILQWEDFE